MPKSKKITIFLLFILLSSCATEEISIECSDQVNLNNEDSELIGVWKSNQAKTLASLNLLETIPEKTRKFFEDDFFGHLTAEYRVNKSRFYFDKEEDNSDDMYDFTLYELLEENEHVFVIRGVDKLTNKTKTTVLGRDGSCYYIPIHDWGFNEYFCKVQEKMEPPL